MKINHLKYVFLVLLLMSMGSCKTTLLKTSENLSLADQNAHLEAKYLLARIKAIPQNAYAFGHQDATAYGIGWKNSGEEYKSDVQEVTGDHPAVHGFELGHLELGHAQNLDTVSFSLMARLIKEAHARGGIITLSWHPDNPGSGKSAWDPTPTVSMVLEGGILAPKYKGWLRRVATFIKGLKTDKGEPIPIVFRPYHEMNGSWFWWGQGNCSPEEFKQLWKETFTTFTEDYELNNIIYCYSTDAVKDAEEYLKFYPGDAYVDILGIDLYHKNTTEEYIELLQDNLGMLAGLAKEKNKPFALTEGGQEQVKEDDWWTQILDKHVAPTGIAWALVWRNAWPEHFYAPFKGQASAADFKQFKSLSHVYFLTDMERIK